MRVPANTKLTLIYLDGTHTIDHFRYQLLPCAVTGTKHKLIDVEKIFGGQNLSFDRKQFVVDVGGDRLILFGTFSSSLYQKLYIALVQYMVSQGR